MKRPSRYSSRAWRFDYAKGAAELSFGFGFKRETVELGGIELMHYSRRVALAALNQ